GALLPARALLRVQSSGFSSRPRNRLTPHAGNQNLAAAPNATRPCELAGENSKPEWKDYKCRSRQYDHDQPDQYNAEANGADEKSAQTWPRFEPETRYPLLKPPIHERPSLSSSAAATASGCYLKMKFVSFCSKCGWTCAVITA